jgi:excisionase family DNA binding protein
VFADLATVEAFAEATGVSVRTVERLIAQRKIPITKFGRKPYVVVSRAREALMAEVQVGHQPVRPGRPSNKRAA